MTKNRTPTPVYLDPGMHSGLEVKGLINTFTIIWLNWIFTTSYVYAFAVPFYLAWLLFYLNWKLSRNTNGNSLSHADRGCKKNKRLMLVIHQIHTYSFSACQHTIPSKNETLCQCLYNVSPSSSRLDQHCTHIGWTFRVGWDRNPSGSVPGKSH